MQHLIGLTIPLSTTSRISQPRLSNKNHTMFRSAFSLKIITIFVILLLSHATTEAYGSVSPKGNITIKWDVVSWTPDGYVAIVNINNFQKRRIQAPGWISGWTWAKAEVLWAVIGAQATNQGDCSRFKSNIPHSCKKSPTIVDLKAETPYNQQIANCCHGGVLSSWFKDREHSLSAFQVSVGESGNTKRTVKLPKNFTFTSPGAHYACGPAKMVWPTRFITPDRRRVTQALMTWKVVCLSSGLIKPHS